MTRKQNPDLACYYQQRNGGNPEFYCIRAATAQMAPKCTHPDSQERCKFNPKKPQDLVIINYSFPLTREDSTSK